MLKKESGADFRLWNFTILTMDNYSVFKTIPSTFHLVLTSLVAPVINQDLDCRKKAGDATTLSCTRMERKCLRRLKTGLLTISVLYAYKRPSQAGALYILFNLDSSPRGRENRINFDLYLATIMSCTIGQARERAQDIQNIKATTAGSDKSTLARISKYEDDGNDDDSKVGQTVNKTDADEEMAVDQTAESTTKLTLSKSLVPDNQLREQIELASKRTPRFLFRAWDK